MPLPAPPLHQQHHTSCLLTRPRASGTAPSLNFPLPILCPFPDAETITTQHCVNRADLSRGRAKCGACAEQGTRARRGEWMQCSRRESMRQKGLLGHAWAACSRMACTKLRAPRSHPLRRAWWCSRAQTRPAPAGSTQPGWSTPAGRAAAGGGCRHHTTFGTAPGCAARRTQRGGARTCAGCGEAVSGLAEGCSACAAAGKVAGSCAIAAIHIALVCQQSDSDTTATQPHLRSGPNSTPTQQSRRHSAAGGCASMWARTRCACSTKIL